MEHRKIAKAGLSEEINLNSKHDHENIVGSLRIGWHQ